MLPKNLFTTLAAATNFQKGITNGVAGVAGVNVAAKAFDDAERASIDDQKVFSDFEKAMAKMKWVELPSNILKILKTSQEVYFVPLSHKAAASAAETAENAEEFFKNFDWSKSGPEIAEAIKNNPKLVIPVGAAAGATVGFLVVGPALGVAGFSSIGPVAGSLASAWQSIGTAGSIFSTVQSAAMGGYGVTSVTGAFAGMGALFGGAAGAASGGKPSSDNPGGSKKT